MSVRWLAIEIADGGVDGANADIGKLVAETCGPKWHVSSLLVHVHDLVEYGAAFLRVCRQRASFIASEEDAGTVFEKVGSAAGEYNTVKLAY